MSRMYLGPVRDMEHAGFLQARFEGDTAREDMFAADLKHAITAHCLRELAQHLGLDGAVDGATADLETALSEDGIALDDHDAARDWLADNYAKHGDWCDHLANRARVAAIRKRKLAAALVIELFIHEVMK